MSRDEQNEVVVKWPDPREDLEEEPSHRAARIADRDRGEERGDVPDDE